MIDTTVLLVVASVGAASLVISMVVALVIIFTRSIPSNSKYPISEDEFEDRLEHDHSTVHMFHGFRGYTRPYTSRTAIGI
jgi:hypothetical protein